MGLESKDYEDTPQKRYWKVWELLDLLKEEHGAKTNQAEGQMRELIDRKNSTYRLDDKENANEAGFMSALTRIYRQVAQACGVDPKDFYDKNK